MKRRVLLSVEGPHDEAVIGRLLRKFHQVERVRNLAELDPLWAELVPRQYPAKDLVARHPVPAFYAGPNSTIAILFGEGSGRTKQLGDSLAALRGLPHAVGVLVDADTNAVKSLEDTQKELRSFNLTPNLTPGGHGEVVRGAIDCGVYVVPGNETGTMDDVLLAAGRRVYGKAVVAAEQLVDETLNGTMDIAKHEQKELRAPAGKKKCTLAITSSLLKPGKAIQNSISDNRWIVDALDEPLVALLNVFLTSLLASED